MAAGFGVNIPKADPKIGAQEIVKIGKVKLCGWLRKRVNMQSRTMDNILGRISRIINFQWVHTYTVIEGGCIYCYKSETSKLPSLAFTLFGYNSIMKAGEILESERPWVFKIIHANPEGKTYYFSADREESMREWMSVMKTEMYIANGKKPPPSSFKKGAVDGKLSVEDEPIYNRAEISNIPYKPPDVDKEDESNYDTIKEADMIRDRPPHAARSLSLPETPDSIAAEKLKRIGAQPVMLTGATKHGERPTRLKPTGLVLPFKTSLKTSVQKPNLHPKPIRSFSADQLLVNPSPTRSPITAPMVSVTETCESGDYVDLDPKSYWSKIFWSQDNSGKPTKNVLQSIGRDGVFLVRPGGTTKYTLEVWSGKDSKVNKYKIHNSPDEIQFWIQEDGAKFPNVEELCHHHYNEKLHSMKGGLTLTGPYGLYI